MPNIAFCTDSIAQFFLNLTKLSLCLLLCIWETLITYTKQNNILVIPQSVNLRGQGGTLSLTKTKLWSFLLTVGLAGLLSWVNTELPVKILINITTLAKTFYYTDYRQCHFPWWHSPLFLNLPQSWSQ